MIKGDVKGTRIFKQNTKKKVLYSDLFNEFYRSMEIRGRAKDTLKTYKHHNKYFMEFLKINYGDNVYCDVIGLETFEDYIRYLKSKGIDNNITINSYMQNVSPIVKYGFKKGYIFEDFYIPYLEVQETFKEIYTSKEINLLLEKPKNKEFTDIRTWAIIWTFATTGIRATELRNLRVGAVDLINRSIVVNNTKNKKARYLPISNSLAMILEEYLQLRGGENEDYLFPSIYNEQMARSSLQKGIKKYCDSRGVFYT